MKKTEICRYRTQPWQPPNIWERVLWPLVQVKKTIERVYHYVLRMFWNELMGKGGEPDPFVQFIAFFIFSFLSFLMYRFRDYDGWIFAGLFLLWLFDRHLAKAQFDSSDEYEIIVVESTEPGKFTWRRTEVDGKTHRVSFESNEVVKIDICYEKFPGGAFEEVVGEFWEVSLVLKDCSLVICQKNDLAQAFREAKRLAKTWDIPIDFPQGEGFDDYTFSRARSWNYKALRSMSEVLVKQAGENDEICTRLTAKQMGLLLLEVFQKSGFLLFLLVATKFMVGYGLFVEKITAPIFGGPKPHIDFSFFTRMITLPKLDILDGIELVLAFVLIGYSTWMLLSQKRIVLDKSRLSFWYGSSKQDFLPLSEIQSILFLRHPTPQLIILGTRKSLFLRYLSDDNVYRCFVLRLEDILEKKTEK